MASGGDPPVGWLVGGGDGLTAIGVCPFLSAAKSSSIVLIEDFIIEPGPLIGGAASGVVGGRDGVGQGEAGPPWPGRPVGKVGLGGTAVGGGGKIVGPPPLAPLEGVDGGGVLSAGVGALTGAGGFIDSPGRLLEELP